MVFCFVCLFFNLILFSYSQGYTNTDNPFGDAHLLENFVWHKVHVHVFFVTMSVYNVIVPGLHI